MLRNRRFTSAAHLANRFLMEGLESRQLLSATLTSAGVLNVQGTGHADAITVGIDSQDTSMLNVTVDGKTRSFDAAQVQGIKVNGGGGKDNVTIDPTVTAPATVQGGGGNDTLTAGSGDDTLNGGAGNDTLVGGSGQDNMIGGTGNDTIICGTGQEQVNAGTGKDSVQFTPTGGAALDTLPQTVQTGLTTLAQGSTIGNVQTFQDNGQTYYGTSVSVDGDDTRIVVDSSGNPVGNPPPGGHGSGGQGGGGQNGPGAAAGIFGSVISVDTTADTITLSATNPWGPPKQTTFTVTDTTAITADGGTIALSRLAAGTLVNVQTSSATSTTATSITAIDRRVGGVVSAIDTTAGTIAITDPSGTSTTYTISPTATVTLDGAASTLSAVTTTSHVQLTLSAIDGTVISINSDPQAPPVGGSNGGDDSGNPGGGSGAPGGNSGGSTGNPTQPGPNGLVTAVDTTADTITLQGEAGASTTYTLASTATVTLDGATSTLSAVVAGDNAGLKLDSDGTTVLAIEAHSPSSSGNSGGSTGNPGGSTGSPGGSTGNPGGSTGNPGGSTGNPGGSTGSPGGSTGNPGGNTGNPTQPGPHGIVVSVDTTANTITLQGGPNNASTTFTLAGSASITLDGAASTLSAIVAGDNAGLKLAADGQTVIAVQANTAPPVA